MTSIKKLKQFIKNASVKSDPDMNQKVLSELLEEIPDRANIWSIIMKKYLPIALGFAAIIIIVSVIFYVTNNPGQNQSPEIVKPTPPPIVIPQELLDMSVEDLLALHYTPDDSTFDPNLVKVALQQALDKLDSEQVLAVANAFEGIKPSQAGGPRGGMRGPSGGIGGPGYPQFPVTVNIENYEWTPVYKFLVNDDLVEEAPNLFVKSRLLGVTINVDDIKKALINRRKSMPEYYNESYRATVELEVLDTSPKDAIEQGQVLEVPTIINKDQLEKLRIGGQYYIGFLQTQSGIEFLKYFWGVFEITQEDEAGVLPTRLWTLFCDTQDALLFGNKPKQNVLDYWSSLINSESFEMAMTYMKILHRDEVPGEAVRDAVVQLLLNEDSLDRAFNYLGILPDRYVPAKEIVDAVEKRYQTRTSQGQRGNTRGGFPMPSMGYNLYGSNSFINDEVIDSLVRSGDKESIQRMINLYEEDRGRGNNGGIIWYNPRFPQQEIDTQYLKLLIALEKDNYDNVFTGIYEKYKNNNIITGIYRNPQAFAKKLLSVMLDTVEKPIDENTKSMILGILDDPAAYGINDVDSFKKMWTALGSSETFDIRSYLDKFFADPNLSNIGIVRTANSQLDFEQAVYDVLMQLPPDKRPNHKKQIDLLFTILIRHGQSNFVVNNLLFIVKKDDVDAVSIISELVQDPFSIHMNLPHIANRVPDPALVPVVKKSLEKGFNIDLLNLLILCGDKESALAIARQQAPDNFGIVKALYDAGDEEVAIERALDMLSKPTRDTNLYKNIIELLAKAGPEYLPIVEQYTEKEELDKLVQMNSNNGSSINGLEQAAIMALARVGGKGEIDRLRYIYETNEDAAMRQIAALALYYIGDDTGWEMLEPIINNTYTRDSELASEFRWQLPIYNVLQEPIANGLLSNERTYALLMEKMRNYIDENDDRAFDSGNSDFFQKYKHEIMPILVDQLNNPSTVVRIATVGYLREITGQNFGFNPRIQYPQEQIIQQWRDYIKREY